MNIKTCLTTLFVLLLVFSGNYSFAQKTTTKTETKRKIVIQKDVDGKAVELKFDDLNSLKELPEDIRQQLEEMDIEWTDSEGIQYLNLRDGAHFLSESQGPFLGVMIGHKIINENGVESEEGVSDLGTVVMDVVDGSPAQAAGLQSDDIITAIDGVATPNHESLTGILADKAPGDEVTVSYLRNGDAFDVVIALGEGGGYAIEQNIEIEMEEEIDDDGAKKWVKKVIINEGDEKELADDVVNKNVSVKKKVDEEGNEVTITTETIVKKNGAVEETITTESGGKTTVQKTMRHSESSTVTSGGKNDLELDEIELFPNPAQGILNLRFKAPAKSTVIELMDTSGKVVLGEVLKDFGGEYQKAFNVKDFPKGQYILTIRQNSKVHTEHVTLQ